MKRDQEVSRVRARLLRFGLPRLEMALVAALAGGGAFLVSAGLLAFGWESLAARTFFATVAGYGFFLFLLRIWLRVEQGRREDAAEDAWDLADAAQEVAESVGDGSKGKDFSDGGGDFGGGGASGSFGDGDTGLDVDLDAGEEIGAVLVVAALVASVVASAFWVVWIAPTLFAELLVDAAIAGGLYRRLRQIDESAWLVTAFRRTVFPFLVVLVVFSASASWLESKAPGARTLGEAVAIWRAAD